MTSTPRADVVCLGESMVTFLPVRPGRLADVPAFERAIGGAESNVACTLAGAGHRVRWVSRVGDDGFGEHLVRTIAAAGVDTAAVRRDPDRPTGIYFRTSGERAAVPASPAVSAEPVQPTGRASVTGGAAPQADAPPGAPSPSEGADAPGEVAYYRAGSAASAMSPDTVDLAAADAGRVLHLTGITAALSADCLALLRVLTAPRPGRPLVSFDVNYRASLWRSPSDARVLLDLARDCDVVFVGEDEAEAAWGVAGGPAAIREALPEPPVLVVKQGAGGATAFVRGGVAPGGPVECAPNPPPEPFGPGRYPHFPETGGTAPEPPEPGVAPSGSRAAVSGGEGGVPTPPIPETGGTAPEPPGPRGLYADASGGALTEPGSRADGAPETGGTALGPPEPGAAPPGPHAEAAPRDASARPGNPADAGGSTVSRGDTPMDGAPGTGGAAPESPGSRGGARPGSPAADASGNGAARDSGSGPARGAGSRGAAGGSPVAGGEAVPRTGDSAAGGEAVHVGAPQVDVVAHVGAGDAFAAGFLSATLRDLPVRDRLRHGHLLAAAALTAPGDLAPPPARAHADRLAALDDEAWGTLRLRPGWTTKKATAP